MRHFFKRRWQHDTARNSVRTAIRPDDTRNKVTLTERPEPTSAGNASGGGNILKLLVWRNGRIERRKQ